MNTTATQNEQVDNSVIAIIGRLIRKYSIRLKILFGDGDESGWSTWLTHPSPSYGEASDWGPFELGSVLQMTIDPLQTKSIGLRVNSRRIDHTEHVCEELRTGGIVFHVKENMIIVPWKADYN